ncbi:AI-2 transport protein TqsA [Novipirellula galeiformis]|uniref:AI-2 transport protein TqsA n=1 Tax=Novipirellula galeiformis TaxID=2528004 RepID=A0A5C6BE41_9BACT|nr:AI-2E family transporter [Novipirellula galeiformis]TWU10393.1 AI-2 transport protein TqsA [Novipirellula galeiformis]
MVKPRSELATLAAVAQLFAVVLIVAALFFARDVFIPLALGLLLSFLLSPIANRLQRLGIPNVLAVITTAAFAFILLASGFTLLGRELTTLVGELPKHKDELVEKARGVAGLTTSVGGSLGNLADQVSEAITKEGEAIEATPPEQTVFQRWTDKLLPAQSDSVKKLNDGTSVKTPLYIKQVEADVPLATWAATAGTVLGPLATAGLVSVFALFMLIHRDDLRDRIIAVISHGDYVTTTEALDEAAQRISRYLVAQTFINTSYGIVLAIGLTSIGAFMTPDGVFPNAILWGVLATCLRYIPYLGPTAAAILPATIALSVFPGYSVFFAVVALITVMELISNNVLEPWLYGTSTGISAVAVIIAAVFWGWLWGPVGLLLSTPLTVCLVVLGRYVPSFKILATLLGDEVEIKTSMRFYQRLLAGDEHRAREVLRHHCHQHDFETSCDDVLVPTIKRIRSDHDADHLNDGDAHRLFAMTGGLIAELPELTESDDAPIASEAFEHDRPTVIGCSSHHFSEALVLNLLRLGGDESFQLETIDDDVMPQEISRQVAAKNPVAVVIVVVPPGGLPQARYLCKSIRDEGYQGAVVVACLGKFKNFDRLFVKFRKAGATSMTTSYSQTRSKVESIVRRSYPAPRIASLGLSGATSGSANLTDPIT